MKTLKIKNNQVLPLVAFLTGLSLGGKESRSRSRFKKLLADRITEIEEERVRLCEKYSTKNKKGEILYLDKDDKETTNKTKESKYNIKDVEEFNKELLEYVSEEFLIDISPANNETVYAVKDIILNVKREFKGEEADVYDELCSAFENIK